MLICFYCHLLLFKITLLYHTIIVTIDVNRTHRLLSVQVGSHLPITQDEGHVQRQIMHPDINMDSSTQASTITCLSAVKPVIFSTLFDIQVISVPGRQVTTQQAWDFSHINSHLSFKIATVTHYFCYVVVQMCNMLKAQWLCSYIAITTKCLLTNNLCIVIHYSVFLSSSLYFVMPPVEDREMSRTGLKKNGRNKDWAEKKDRNGWVMDETRHILSLVTHCVTQKSDASQTVKY